MAHIKKQLVEIITTIIGNNNIEFDNDAIIEKMLHIIMSHSIQSINFVSIIEDEFNVEFEDEDINLNTFLNINEIIKLVEKYSAKNII